MKKMISLLLLPVAFVFGSNEDLMNASSVPEIPKPSIAVGSSMTYLKTGPGFMGIIPKVGVGHRMSFGRNGLDISYSSGVFFRENDLFGAKALLAGLEVDYLIYFDAKSPSRAYIGLGAKPGIREDQPTLLLTPEVLFGYEFSQKGKMKGFVQLEIRPVAITQSLLLSPVTFGLGFGF